jgi:hypothetical protein
VFRLPGLAKAVIDNISVDEGLDVIEISDIVGKLRGLGTPDVDFRVVPGTVQSIGEISYVVPIDHLAQELFSRLREGRRLGDVGLELDLTDLHANVTVRVLDAGGDVALVRERLADGGFEVLPSIDAPSDASSTILYGPGEESAAGAAASYLAGLFAFEGSPTVAPAPKGSLGDADIGILVSPEFPEPVRRSDV